MEVLDVCTVQVTKVNTYIGYIVCTYYYLLYVSKIRNVEKEEA